MTRVGWIGLGAMGAPMAAIAAIEHDVIAYDIDPRAADRVAGIQVAASIADAAQHADLLVLMVATQEQAESVLFGQGGAVDALPQGAVVVILATVGPEPLQEWSRRLQERGVGLVDAPVSGGVARAGAGDLLIMVSGKTCDVEAATGLLDALARTAPIVGEKAGDGQKVKLVNQLLCGVHIAVAGEALAFAESLGVDPRACWDVIRQGAAASFMLDDRGERMLEGDFDVARSAVDIFVKDMGLVNAAAAASGAWTPIATTAQELYLRAREQGYGRSDDSVLIETMRRAR